MRTILLIALMAMVSLLQAQTLKPQSIYASYFGETLTHPGIKIGASYELKGWGKIKSKRNGKEKTIQKSINFCPGIGFYSHKHYQTGLLVLPEINFSRKNEKGNYFSFAVGSGYMRTFIPNVYELDSNGEIEKLHVGYNYFVTNYSLEFGKDLSVQTHLPVNIFVKPQLLNAIPNYSKSVWYFAFELGLRFRLTTEEKN